MYSLVVIWFFFKGKVMFPFAKTTKLQFCEPIENVIVIAHTMYVHLCQGLYQG